MRVKIDLVRVITKSRGSPIVSSGGGGWGIFGHIMTSFRRRKLVFYTTYDEFDQKLPVYDVLKTSVCYQGVGKLWSYKDVIWTS